MHPRHIDNYDTTPTPNALLALPPHHFLPILLFLFPLLRLRLAVDETAAVSAVGADDQHNVVAKPRLQLRHHAAVLARQRLLQVDDLGLDVAQDVGVALRRRERQDHALLFDERLGLRVHGVEGGVGGGRANAVIVNNLSLEDVQAWVLTVGSSPRRRLAGAR